MVVATRSLVLIYATAPLLFLAVLSVGLRLHVRVVLLKNGGLDDWLCLGALCLCIIIFTANMIAIGLGFGYPMTALPAENRTHIAQAMWISPALWGLSTAVVKMSIVSSYLRIFSSRRFVQFSYVLQAVLVVFGLTLFFGGLFACVPVDMLWGVPHGDGGCINKPLFMMITSSWNIALDLLVIAIPVPLVRKLQIPKKQRIALVFVFTIGAVVCIASVMRLVEINNMISGKTGAEFELAVWSGVEHNLTIICACLPTLRPVIARVFPKLLSTVATSTRRRTRTFDGDGPFRMQSLRSHDDGSKEKKKPHVRVAYPDTQAAMATTPVDDKAHTWFEDEARGSPDSPGTAGGYIRYGGPPSTSTVTPTAPALSKTFGHKTMPPH